MKNLRAKAQDLIKLAPLSNVFEISMDHKTIRKKPKTINKQITLLGFGEDGIRGLSSK